MTQRDGGLQTSGSLLSGISGGTAVDGLILVLRQERGPHTVLPFPLLHAQGSATDRIETKHYDSCCNLVHNEMPRQPGEIMAPVMAQPPAVSTWGWVRTTFLALAKVLLLGGCCHRSAVLPDTTCPHEGCGLLLLPSRRKVFQEPYHC